MQISTLIMFVLHPPRYTGDAWEMASPYALFFLGFQEEEDQNEATPKWGNRIGISLTTQLLPG